VSAEQAALALASPEVRAIPVPEYDADRTAVRKSWLDLIERSPAHLRAHLDGYQAEETEPLFKGTLIHAVVLEPDSIGSRYYLEPDGDGRTKAVKEARAEAATLNPGKIPVRKADLDMAVAVRDSVYSHKAAKALLGADGEVERSIFWTNRDTGEACKARLDKLSQTKAFIADVKSTRDASPAAFAKSIVNYRYDVQAVHYAEPVDLRFVFIAVEKLPPYAVAVYAVNAEILKLGKVRRDPNLRTYAECRAADRWPSYPETIQHITLPAWAFR
jgi:hypothetical protein